MITEDNINEQNKNLEEMDYNANEDIFNQEKSVSIDENGNILTSQSMDEETLDGDLDVPGEEADDDMEEIGEEDEENNYWSTSDNDDDHEEINEDLVD